MLKICIGAIVIILIIVVIVIKIKRENEEYSGDYIYFPNAKDYEERTVNYEDK